MMATASSIDRHDPAKYNTIRKRVPSSVVIREYAQRISQMEKMNIVSIPNGLEALHISPMEACFIPELMI